MRLPDIERRFAPRGILASTYMDESMPGETGAHARGAAFTKTLLVCSDPALPNEELVSGLRGLRFFVRPCGASEALEQLGRDDWDVVLIDEHGGVGGALTLIHAIRAGFPAALLPVVVLGGASQSEARADAFKQGASDWIMQPADLADVSRRLATLADLGRLRRQRAAEHGYYRAKLSARSSRLNGLIETCIMMSMSRDRAALLQQLLSEGRRLLHCDGATMYMVTDQETLRFELRTRSDPLPSVQIPLYDSQTGRPNENYVSVYTAVHNCSVRIDDVYRETRFDLSGTRAFDIASGYRTVSMLTVPIAPRGGAPIGVLQFMNALDPINGAIVPFDPESVALVEALAAQAAVALDNLELVESQKQLMESLIQVLATAIDAKSPYTGRHCERVPDLAMGLAKAACDATEGPFATFGFRSDAEWEEFRIGAWLHDCGKVATPEYVIDKATKLETIQNRIHEVRMRFEVLRRDLEIERLRAQLAGTCTAETDAAHRASLLRLEEDFAFVAKCNKGTETMGEDAIARLARIGALRWTRHFDDRLGLSEAELASRADEAVQPLPCSEPLLADRARDLIVRPADDQPDPSFNFRMEVPQHLYNRGELYNLSVRSGTLTREERYKINEHMVHTVMMLEQMPFPKHLRRVPEYAGTHHERMDGKGYPRQLGPQQLSVPSRIMAVADIFEALTAADRPYKKPKKLSEALAVLQKMSGAHVDADVFNLFLRSGVYLEFARKHLQPEQIDVSDPSPYYATVQHG
ncbi:HD domain-containing phosphohydrolase [Roseateles sp.]|uniref:HD domain-containing phosphohydrolase n=1 Tax=Roseateles sp. TaxID=1971397 RepID=UPI00286B5CD8|nr:HD domain-containing phosphohydrolase [Roseateles sp.]